MNIESKPSPDYAEQLKRLRSTCKRVLNGHGVSTAAELLSAIPTDLGMDHYGSGGAVAALEDEVRAVLKKPAAVFMPSGTMAQQIVLRIHADRRGVRACGFHPTCHLDLFEERAYERLHGLVGVPIGSTRELITLESLKGVRERMAAVLFELPQREIGGCLPDWSDLEEQVAFVRTTGAAVHLDGARLWECTPYYERSPAEIAALFDTIYVSFYKGLGGLAGSCLAGDDDIIAESRIWRRRHGGTLFGLWPHAASGLAALRRRLPRMPDYVSHARAIAERLRGIRNVEVVPDPPQTSMMHLHLRVAETAYLQAAVRLAEEEGIYTWGSTSPAAAPSIRVVEFTVGDATLNFAPDEVAGIVAKLAEGSVGH
ncbi:MAG TPA: beta-eliminating lyase-related protein [Gemmatimonadaceae bacterium]|nr:beta-eliminating lyase-related protein [Gemmatimonadaceae bacterium]